MLIITKVLGPTNTRPTRVKATSAPWGDSVTIPWDYSANHVDMHARAAAALVRKMNGQDAAQYRGEYVTIRLVGDAGARVGYAYDAQIDRESAFSRQATWDADGNAIT